MAKSNPRRSDRETEGMSIKRSWKILISCAVFLVLIVADFIRIDVHSHSASDTLRPWIIHLFILAVILFLVFRIASKSKDTL
jgi:hypothetical protein